LNIREINEEEKETAKILELQNYLKNVIDDADPATPKTLKELPNKKRYEKQGSAGNIRDTIGNILLILHVTLHSF